MRARSRFTLLAALAVGCALASACSCGSSEGTGGAGAGGAVASTSASSTTASSTTISSTGNSALSSSSSGGPSVDKNGCEILPYPAGVPQGWVEWTDWSCNCRFYVPGSKEAMPAPIKWEACPPEIPGCRMMVTDWTDSITPIAFFPKFNVNPDGSASILFRRLQPNVEPRTMLDLAADVDGPVRAALLRFRTPEETAAHIGCFTGTHSYQDDRMIVGFYGDDVNDVDYSDHEGAVGGKVDAPVPSVLMHNIDDMDYVWAGDKDWFVRGDSRIRIYAKPWSLDSEAFISSAATDPEHLQLSNIKLANGAIFWGSSSSLRSGINVWDQAKGARPLIRWIGDATRGAGGLGTDGIDMVWAYGEGKQPSDIKYPVQSVMTAKFSTDADTIAASARRLRSYSRPCLECDPWVVACGYAANFGEHNSTMVVRLSDGWSWQGPADLHPLGLTCDEVFVMGDAGTGKLTIARIKLSELGPGMAPD